jgi:phosphatidate cytidylyltransferase
MLRWRFVTALVLAPVVLYTLFLGHWAILVVTLIAVALAAYELADALRPLPLPAAFGAGAFPVLLSIPPYGESGILAGTVLSLPWALFWLTSKPEARTLRAILALLLMALWVGMPLAYLGLIGELNYGSYLIIAAVVGPWISDAGAYFAGLLFGRHAIFPTLSPKKTVEGATAGLLITVVIVGYFAYGFLGFTIVQAVLSGLTISVFSQAGDLFESVLKRLLGLKDLGRVLPGHGGILDRIDSLLFTAPAVYYLYILFIL